MMNRKARRALEKKLGEDFPLDQFLALQAYYYKSLELGVTDFMIYLLKRYIPLLYEEKKDLIEGEDFEDENER